VTGEVEEGADDSCNALRRQQAGWGSPAVAIAKPTPRRTWSPSTGCSAIPARGPTSPNAPAGPEPTSTPSDGSNATPHESSTHWSSKPSTPPNLNSSRPLDSYRSIGDGVARQV